MRISGVNDLASTPERIVLPRGIDHAVDIATLAENAESGGSPGERIEIATLILDFVDAFMSMALHPKERRFACASLSSPPSPHRGKFVVWKVLGFGGKPNPLVYSRAASFASRSGQALFDPARSRLQLFVDDPALSVMGTARQCSEE
eukprot:5489497-Karenia_brevis.AAC.1